MKSRQGSCYGDGRTRMVFNSPPFLSIDPELLQKLVMKEPSFQETYKIMEFYKLTLS